MPYKTWAAQERLTAADLNAAFQFVDSEIAGAGTDASALVSGTVNNARLPELQHSKLPAGSILQVVTGTSSTQTTQSNVQTYLDTGVTATITPRFADSKIYVVASMSGRSYRVDDDANLFFKIVRDTTDIRENWSGVQGAGTSTIDHVALMTLTVLDEPATTSAVTYKVQFKQASSSGTRTVTVNYAGPSTITLLEIAG